MTKKAAARDWRLNSNWIRRTWDDPTRKPHTMYADDFDSMAMTVGDYLRETLGEVGWVTFLRRLPQGDWAVPGRSQESLVREFHRALGKVLSK